MGKTLVIVESPTKGDKIQAYLGDDYIVKSSKGHITNLSNTGTYNTGVDFSNKYRPKYVLMDDKLDVLKDLVNAANRSDSIIMATDDDRSGTFISAAIAERLEDLNKPIKKMVLGEITKPKILKSIANLKDLKEFESVVEAEKCRSVLDKIVGFMVSPFLMETCKAKLSAGRVQSVAVRLIIDREREIEQFKPETFFTINVNVATVKNNTPDTQFVVKYDSKIKTQSVADDIVNKIKSSVFVVEDITDDFENKHPPAPMITSTLQQVMASLHGFEPERTMKAAQYLYENGLCTYIRTDSVKVDDEALKNVREYLKNNNYSIPPQPNEYKNKESAQDAHECIRPTQVDLLPDDNYVLTDDDEKKVYEVIWRYFLASQCSPAKYSTRKITIKSTSENVGLKASGKALIDSNYLDLLGQEDKSSIEIPNCNIGDNIILFDGNSVVLEKKKTKPPARYIVATLVKALENRKLGRPATYAEILSKITTRGYVEKKGNVYHATELGKKINDILVKHFSFMDFDFTKRMEDDLDKVGEGKMTYLELMDKFFPDFKKELNKAYIDSNIGICSNCEFPLKTSKDGKEYCSNFVNCKYIRR